MMENRRLFTRILFSTKAVLIVDNEELPVKINDLSLNGALVTRPNNAVSLKEKQGILSFSLGENTVPVNIQVAVAHEETNEIGLKCHSIDIDSLSQLKRLVELNLGDEDQLNRELSQLNRHE